MEKRKQNKIVIFLAYVLGTGMFYYNSGGVEAGSFTIMTKYLFAMGILAVGFFAFLMRPELSHMKRAAEDSLVLALPFCLPVFFSMAI